MKWLSARAWQRLITFRNFGIVKHPGTGSSTKLSTLGIPDDTSSLNLGDPSQESKGRRPSSSRNDASSTAQDQLKAKGFIPIQWHGKCEADKVSMGTFAVTSGQGGMYGLIFDNTFSKAVSKTATFVLLTYPTNAPPNSTHHLHNLQAAPGAMASALSLGVKSQSPRLNAVASESVDSLQSNSIGPRSRAMSEVGRTDADVGHSHVGIMMKRRRKRGQGYARRYFSLDFVSYTLSYYYNRNSSALRGAIPLSLAAISADERRREISIDSGAEIWHLKALNAKDFDDWTKALESASNAARGATQDSEPSPARLKLRTTGLSTHLAHVNPEEEREWEQVESLVSRIVGTRDAVRRLAKDTKSSNRQSWANFGLSSSSPSVPEEGADYFTTTEKRPFWKRKSSAPSPKLFDRSVISQLAVPVPALVTTISANGSSPNPPKRTRHQSREEHSIHDHCTALLSDLDSVLAEFSTLIAGSKRRRMPAPVSATSRLSIETTSTGEFYDAEAGDTNDSQLLVINRESGEDTPGSEADEFVSDATSISSTGEDSVASPDKGSASIFPPKPKSLTPLPLTTAINRRTNVVAAKVLPPSLISFLRKNVGKDLSTISMPVSANEPTSLLQRLAENLEYSALLDTASQHKIPAHRLLHIAAFAVSTFSNGRARERAIRKPFNPMLGETFELVRSDKEVPGNFRFIAEKVSHRPVKLACQADSDNWSFIHAAAPIQKFWGKSAELITDGRVRVVLRLKDGTDECYSWNVATVFLRNVVMGEKYVEPVGSITVLNETTGAKATIEFKTKGMFGGRSEDVVVESYDSKGTHTSLSLAGTWTSSLRLVEAGKSAGAEIWRVGNLVSGFPDRYGFTEFAATLNEITAIENGKMCMTDSRQRLDQQAVEVGDLDTAEEVKQKLEEGQRARRARYADKGEEWAPRWFVKGEIGANGEEEGWRLKGGKDGYWEERARGSWSGVEDVLAV